MNQALPIVYDGFSKYLSEVRAFPRLSEQEEFRLAVRFVEEQDLEAAHRLITANLRFVVKIASEYRDYGIKMMDLVQEGNIGLMLAVKKFNPYRGFRLITYAVWWIRAQIQSFIISSWSLLKIGTTQAQRKLFFKLKQAQGAIRRMTGGEDDSAETARYLNVDEGEVAEMDLRMQGELSLDAALVAGEDGSLLDHLADDRPNQECLLSDLQEQQRVEQLVQGAVAGLNEKERYVVEHRFMADEVMTLQEIADILAISRERVRQIEQNALKKIKCFLGNRIVVKESLAAA